MRDRGFHALLTKAMDKAPPALPSVPNIGLIFTYNIVFRKFSGSSFIKMLIAQQLRACLQKCPIERSGHFSQTFSIVAFGFVH